MSLLTSMILPWLLAWLIFGKPQESETHGQTRQLDLLLCSPGVLSDASTQRTVPMIDQDQEAWYIEHSRAHTRCSVALFQMNENHLSLACNRTYHRQGTMRWDWHPAHGAGGGMINE